MRTSTCTGHPLTLTTTCVAGHMPSTPDKAPAMKCTRDADQPDSDQAAALPGSKQGLKRIKHTHQDASTASDAHVPDQQGHQPAAQQLSSAAAGEDVSVAAAASTADFDTKGGTQPCDSDRPAAARQEQPPHAAAAAAEGAARRTARDRCSSSSSSCSQELASAFRKWAGRLPLAQTWPKYQWPTCCHT
jgi:hypothetical protein